MNKLCGIKILENKIFEIDPYLPSVTIIFYAIIPLTVW